MMATEYLEHGQGNGGTDFLNFILININLNNHIASDYILDSTGIFMPGHIEAYLCMQKYENRFKGCTTNPESWLKWEER